MYRLLSKKSVVFFVVVIVVTLIAVSLLSQNKNKDSTAGSLQSPSGSNSNTGGLSNIFVREEAKDPLSGLNDDIYMPANPPASSVAVGTKAKALPHLPIYIGSFQTSVGIPVNVNIYTIPTDPDDVIRFEIQRINYENQDSNPKTNPDVTAFKEGFLKGKGELQKIGVDMRDANFIFGIRQYVKETANLWVKQLNLL